MRKRNAKDNNRLKGGLRSIKNSPKREIYLVLDNIRSMYNVGAMFRTADGARVKKIYLCGMTAQPPRNKIYKTSLGAVEHVEWEYFKKTESAIDKLKNDGVQIVSLEQTTNSVHYKSAKYSRPVAIVVGHELKGVKKPVLEKSDVVVEIPMHGLANSLNVATSCGIILFEVLDQTTSK